MPGNETGPILRLSLLGSPRVTRNGAEITAFRTAKARGLLFYLAASDSGQPRPSLAALFWPEASQKKANASLRNSLSNLRRLLGDHLAITRQAVDLRRETLWLDVDQFEVLLKRTGDRTADALRYQAAVSMYEGDFLQGFHVAGSPGFEQWMAIKREHLREEMLAALLALAEWHADQRDYAASLDHLTHLLSLEPASEAGHRQKMVVLARMGQRNAALVQYDTCRRILQEELGVEPGPETIALRELILAGALGQAEGQFLSAAQAPHQAGAFSRLAPVAVTGPPPSVTPSGRPAIDYGDMPARTAFYGREEVLARLNRWLTQERTGLVAITGLGGVGKTTLAVALVEGLSPGSYDTIVWRSLVNAPPLSTLLGTWLQTLAGQRLDLLPDTLDEQLALLFGELQRQRCLLVLDNVESIMQSGAHTGRFRPGYEDYGQLVERMGRSRHQSCLLLTARELPRGLQRLEEDYPQVRVMALAGLPSGAGMELLRARGVDAPDRRLQPLVERYSGNPLALKLVADTVRDLFAGDVQAFLGDETPVFDDIRDVLDEQFGRLSELGQEILFWVAVEREPVMIETLWNNLVRPTRRRDFLELARSLQRNSLVEEVICDRGREAPRLGLQNVVMEYATDRLVQTLGDELESGRVNWLHRHALVKAHSPEYVQESQRRLLLQPIARRLVDRLGRAGAVERLRALLALLHEQSAHAPGYAGAGILHLLLELQVNLRGFDFSQLAVWQADLRRASLVEVDLRGADLTGSTFSDTFGAITCVAVSPDGSYLAAGGTDGVVYLWCIADYQPKHMLRGHTLFVTALAFSDDGRFLASGGYDDEIRLWDVQTGGWVRSLRRQDLPIQAWSMSMHGELLAVAGMDKTIHVWNWQSGEGQRNLSLLGPVSAVALSPNGRLLAGAGEEPELYLWDASSGELLCTRRTEEGRHLAAAISADGELLAVGGEDSRIHLWNIGDMSLRQVLPGHGSWILSLAFSPDGRYLASGSADHTARLWDIEEDRPLRVFTGHSGWVRSVAFTPDGRSLVTGGDDQTVRMWDTGTAELLHYFQGTMRWVDFVRFSPSGRMLVSTSFGGAVRLWDVETGRLLQQLQDQQAATRALAFSHDGSLLACGSDDHTARLWSTQTGALVRVLRGHRGPVRDIAFGPDDRSVITGSHDDTLCVWDVATGLQKQVIPHASARIQFAMALDPSGEFLGFGALDHGIRLLHISSGKIVGSIPMAGKIPSVVAFSAQGDCLACGARDGTVWIWDWDMDAADAGDMDIQAPRYQGQAQREAIWRLLFSPDGQQLAYSSENGDMHVIDLASGLVRYSVPSHYGAFCLDFSTDGRFLITAGPDNEILLRDVMTGEVRHSLLGHAAGITSLAVSPGGERMASSGADGTVRLWDLKSGACVAILEPERPYAGMNITGVTGITEAQKATLIALGAVEDT